MVDLEHDLYINLRSAGAALWQDLNMDINTDFGTVH